MADTDYCVTTGINIITGSSPNGPSIEIEKSSMTTTSFELYTSDTNSSEHPEHFWVCVHGELA